MGQRGDVVTLDGRLSRLLTSRLDKKTDAQNICIQKVNEKVMFIEILNRMSSRDFLNQLQTNSGHCYMIIVRSSFIIKLFLG